MAIATSAPTVTPGSLQVHIQNLGTRLLKSVTAKPAWEFPILGLVLQPAPRAPPSMANEGKVSISAEKTSSVGHMEVEDQGPVVVAGGSKDLESNSMCDMSQ